MCDGINVITDVIRRDIRFFFSEMHSSELVRAVGPGFEPRNGVQNSASHITRDHAMRGGVIEYEITRTQVVMDL